MGKKVLIEFEVNTATGELQVKRLINSFKLAGESGQASAKQAQNAFDTMGGSLKTVQGLASSVGFAFGAWQVGNFLKDVVSESIKFQSTMANVNSILSDSDVRIDELSKGVENLGSELGSSSQLADALYEALGAGVPAAQSLDFVATSAKLAKANLFEAGDATRLLAVIMNAYGKEVTDVNHVSDVFSTTIAEGVVRGQQLAGALGTVIPTAAQVGVSIEEVSAAIAIMTKVGNSADESTTALNQALLSFISPSKEAQKAAEKYGFELSATALKEKGLQQALTELTGAVKGNDQAIASVFGNVRAYRAVLALTGEQAEEFKATIDRMTDAVGVTDEMFKKQTETIQRQWEIAVINAHKALSDFLDTAKGPALEALKNINQILEAMREFKTIPAIIEGATEPLRDFLGLFSGDTPTNIRETVGMITDVINWMSTAARTILYPTVGLIVDTLNMASGMSDALRTGDFGNLQTVIESTRQKYIELGKGLGFVSEETDKTNIRVKILQERFLRAGGGLKSFLSSGGAVPKLLRDTGDTAGEASKDMENLLKQFNSSLHPSAALAAEIKKLQSAGISTSDILKVYASRIAEAAKKEIEMGEALDPLIAKLFPGGLAAAAGQAAAAMHNLNGEAAAAAASAGRASDGMGGLAVDAAQAAAHTQDVAEALDAAEPRIITVANNAFKLGAIFSELGDILGSEELQNIGDIFTGAGTAAMGFSQIMSGDVLNGILNVTKGVGQLFKALTDLFKKDWGKEAQKMANAMGFWISKELGDEIAEAAKKMGVDLQSGILLSLDLIADEIGITANNVNTFINAFTQATHTFQAGSQMALDVAEDLNSLFDELKENSIDAFGHVSDELLGLIIRTREWGVEVKAITDFVNSQLDSGSEGLNAWAETFQSKWIGIVDRIKETQEAMEAAFNAGDMQEYNRLVGILDNQMEKLAQKAIRNQGEFNRLSTSVFAMIAAYSAQGMSMQQIFERLGPAIGILFTAVEELGLQGSEALAPFLEFYEITQKFPKSVETISNVQQVLVALMNTGFLTVDAFKALEDQGRKAAKHIIDDGQLSQAEWKSVEPFIMSVIAASERYGFTLDKQTKKIIDMARENGFLSDSDPAPTMEQTMSGVHDVMIEVRDVLTEIKNILPQIASGFGAVGASAASAAGEASAWTSLGGGGFIGGGGIKGRFASGPVARINAPGAYYLDPGDVVIPPKGNSVGPILSGSTTAGSLPQAAAGSPARSGNGQITITAPLQINIVNKLQMNGQDMAEQGQTLMKQGLWKVPESAIEDVR